VVTHAFCNDALGDLDAVGVAERIRRGEVSPREVVAASIARAERVNPSLNAIQFASYEQALKKAEACAPGVFTGVPTFVKDNTDVRGLPTGQGSRAFAATPAVVDNAFARQFMAQGFVVLGKSTLPEFGFNASTEFEGREPTRNPWHLGYSSGASSGGAAALVASGVVPIAHANDGGGSIRIPAACCGLIGLKPTRGRLVDSEAARSLPLNVIAEGVVTRSVRDTANFFWAAERFFRNRALPPIGLVEGPNRRRLKIGLVFESIIGRPTDPDTSAALSDAAVLLQGMGHQVEEMPMPIKAKFAEDFSTYWGLLAYLVAKMGHRVAGPDFDPQKLDNFTKGLAGYYRQHWLQTPWALRRLKRSQRDYAQVFNSVDVILSPVLAHTTPKLGYLAPEQPFEELFDRLHRYVIFTPWNNAAGGPAMSLPLGATASGLPIGIHFSAGHGNERSLLELAFEIERALPWRRIQDAPR